MAVVKCGSDYEKYFDGDRYMEVFYSPKSKYADKLQFVIEKLHNAFEDGKIGGKDLLDVGSGPTIHSIISACNNVENVYLSDYASKNIETLKKWWRGERNIQEHMIQQVCSLENKGQTIEERTDIMRQKVKGIVHIDVFSENLLTGSEAPKEYDVITSSFCLDAASQTKEEYIKCVTNVHKILKKGGYFVLVGGLDYVYLMLDDVKFVGLCINVADTKAIFQDLGFDIQMFEEVSSQADDKEANPSTFIMVAQKVV